MLFDPNVYTVESVTSGHPDKICDQISDAILDATLAQDPNSRVAMEAAGGHGKLKIFGEITTTAEVDYAEVARELYRNIGHNDDLVILTNVVKQSPDIAMGVDTGGAGDQGIMYGYATDETSEYLPFGVVLAHKLARGLEDLRKSGELNWILPDGKTQVTIDNGILKTVLVSTQHSEEISQTQIRQELIEKLIEPLANTQDLEILINPTGRFVQGGFEADTGLTGRKIMVDTYGGLAPHGGGAFSGKDPSKVDRSAAYMSRFVAKNIVAEGNAKKCLVSVSYAIGKAEPLMVSALNENGDDISELARLYDFRPRAIIEQLDLLKPIYLQTAAYGHFGKAELPWESIKTPAII